MTKYNEKIPTRYLPCFVNCLSKSNLKGQFLKHSNETLLKDACVFLMEYFLDKDFEDFPQNLKSWIIKNNQSYGNFPSEFFSDEEISLLILISDINDIATDADRKIIMSGVENINN